MDNQNSNATNLHEYESINHDNVTHISSKKSRVSEIHKRRIIALLSVMGVVFLFFGFQIGQAQVVNNDMNQKIAVQQKKYKMQKEVNSNLKDRIKELNNKDYLEKVIRSKYSYSKSDEQIYNLPSSND